MIDANLAQRIEHTAYANIMMQREVKGGLKVSLVIGCFFILGNVGFLKVSK